MDVENEITLHYNNSIWCVCAEKALEIQENIYFLQTRLGFLERKTVETPSKSRRRPLSGSGNSSCTPCRSNSSSIPQTQRWKQRNNNEINVDSHLLIVIH